MSKFDPWKNKKTHKFGKYVVYSVESDNDIRKWYTEVHMESRHGLLYRASYGSNMRFRILAVLETLIRYKGGTL